MFERFDVVVQWFDDPNNAYFTRVVVDPDWTEKPDDPSVFFYFANVAEFEDAKREDTDLDFRILEVC